MKTITVRDDTYRKLLSLKGRGSFSDVIDDLIRRDVERRVGKIIEACRAPPPSELEEIVRRLREEFKARA